MGRSVGDQLRDLLFRQAKGVSDDAIQADGQVTAEQVEALERLARLVETCKASQPRPPRKRWPLATVMTGTLVIVSILLFARVSETEIELDLALSEVGFVLPTQQVLADEMELSSLGVSGLREIRLPRARGQAARILNTPEHRGSSINVSVASEGKQHGTVTLGTLALPAGTRVRVRHTEVAHQYRFSLNSAPSDLRADVNGPVRIGLSSAPAETLHFTSPRSILLRPDSNEVDLDLIFSGPSQGTFSPQLSTSDLSLFRIDQFMHTEFTVVRLVSTVLSGALYLESLNGLKRMLRPGEELRFKESYGEIRTLQLRDDHIALKFHGRVRGMSTGSDENPRSLMPTYLEWLRARHGLSLLWGTTLYLFGLIVGTLRWWGKLV